MTEQIQLVQVPVIEHKLLEVGKNVTARIAELNLGNLVATDDTIKSLKELRAELNKEFTEFETQRKALKTAVINPYMDFETVYMLEISDKYKKAGELLKDKIGEFEARVKTEKKNNIVLYFAELIADAKIDFLKFEHTGLEINLSTSEKQYKEKCIEFVNRVSDDILLINGMDYAPETMAEYKTNGLNASKAISTVRERKEAERLEKERIKAAETNRRVTMLRNIGFVYHDMTKSYNWVNNDTVYLELSDIENSTKEQFATLFAQAEQQVKENTVALEATQAPTPAPAAPLKAPVEVPQPQQTVKVVTASFTVTGTMTQLKALGEYMRANNITYKNI